ncbi:MAG: sulfotransferase [Caulobacter sp.]|nr:sulfotransferase [Caulobacter sp.]
MQPPADLQTQLALAGQYRRAGQTVQAEAAYRAVLALWPDLPDSWFNLALMQRRNGRFSQALDSYQQALTRRISGPEEVHLNRAVILVEDLQQPEAAERELITALKLKPRYGPALLNLGNLYEDMGRRDEALSNYGRLLAIDPGHPEALARASGLTTPAGPEDPGLQALSRALQRPDLPPGDKANLAFAFGRGLDACGAYEAAFAAYESANRFSRASAPPGQGRYDRLAQERRIDQLIRVHDRPAEAGVAVAQGFPPIFICGMFRSGSTLVEQVLASHPKVTSGGELDLLPRLVAAAGGWAGAASRGPEVATAMARDYLAGLRARFPQADIVTDKRPDNFLQIGLIKRMFPDARIVFTRRASLDVCLSNYFLHLDHGQAYALDLLDTGHFLQQHDRLMDHWQRLYPDEILELSYDALVANPRPVIETLLAFCGLDWEETCLEFHRSKTAVRTASVWQVRQPLYQASSGRWRHYERQLAPLVAFLGISGAG